MWLAMEGIGVRKKGGDSGAFIGGRWARYSQNFVCSGAGAVTEFWFWSEGGFGALDSGLPDGVDTVSGEARESWGAIRGVVDPSF
jgi:hypothetical protein